MAYQVSELNGIKIYNFSAGKTLPQFLEEAEKKNKSLRYNQEFKRRIELIQDFDFSVASTQVEMTDDNQYVIATGLYPPSVKIFETSELSVKCERRFNAEVVKFCILNEDYTKLAFLCNDRNIEFQAQYGKHYKLRIPKFPRDMIFNRFTCDLCIAASTNELYRLNLEEGQFLSAFQSASEEVLTLDFNKQLNVLLSGGMSGLLEIWDYRQRDKAANLLVASGQNISKISSQNQSMQFAVGGTKGQVRIYDFRQPNQYMLEVQHKYRMPINSLIFHEKTKNLISADKKIIKIYNKDNGKTFTNIEPKNAINQVCLVNNSGLFFVANEDIRIGTYFLPALDVAPKWCPFIENITEELEENFNQVVYDEFKFLTYDELETLNATNLIGTKMLKSHMHGYIMHFKLYNKLKSLSDPFEYERFRKQKIQEKLEEKSKNRISLKKIKGKAQQQQTQNQQSKIKVNKEYLQALEDKISKKKAKKDNVNKEDKVNALENIKSDPRFAKMFQEEQYEIDMNAEEFKIQNPQLYQRQLESGGLLTKKSATMNGLYNEDENLQEFESQNNKKVKKDNYQSIEEQQLEEKAIQKKQERMMNFEQKLMMNKSQRKAELASKFEKKLKFNKVDQAPKETKVKFRKKKQSRIFQSIDKFLK